MSDDAEQKARRRSILGEAVVLVGRVQRSDGKELQTKLRQYREQWYVQVALCDGERVERAIWLRISEAAEVAGHIDKAITVLSRQRAAKNG